MQRFWLVLLIFWSLTSARPALAEGPADSLLKLVSSDSVATLVVENLRDRSREVVGSPLYEGLLRLPAIRSCLASGPGRKAEQASRDVRQLLGVPPGTIRDELLGDAFVLALQAGPSDRPDQSRGLLLTQPRDRALMARLIQAFNDAQTAGGELAGIESRSRGSVKYSARLFKAPGRLPEFYVLLDQGPFAWSNSEALLQGVIDRQVSGQAGLADDPDFRKVRGGLPDRALASLFLSTRWFEQAIGGEKKPGGERVAAMLGRYLAAVGRLGLAIEWRDGISLHSTETLDPRKLDPWLKTWLTRPSSPPSLPSRISPATVALISASVDYRAILSALGDLIPPNDRPDLDNLKVVLQGLFLGRDPLVDVLPRMAPELTLAIEIEPDRSIGRHFPMIAAVRWSNQPGASDLSGPIDNAMKTLLGFYSLSANRSKDRLRVESRSIGEARLNLLTDGSKTLAAYRVDRDRMIVGNSPEAVARFATGSPPSTIADLKARDFADAETFAIVDLVRLTQEIRAFRGPIAQGLADRSRRPVASVDQDLGALIDLGGLFKAATFRSAALKEATEIHRSIGLIAR